MALGDVCELLAGFPFDSSRFVSSGIRLMRGMNVKRGYLDFAEENNRYWESSKGLEKYLLADMDIIVQMDGSLVGKSYGMVSESQLPLLLVQRVARLRATKIQPRYLYHVIASGALSEMTEKKKTAGAVPHISMKDIAGIKLVLPSAEVQRAVVEVLDQFDAIVNDISQGLPAEIEARRKQYTYYRDKLLSFKEKVA